MGNTKLRRHLRIRQEFKFCPSTRKQQLEFDEYDIYEPKNQDYVYDYHTYKEMKREYERLLNR